MNQEPPGELMEQARVDLAKRTGKPPGSFAVKKAEAVEWPDASLGCGRAGMMYAQVITPGYRIVLEADGKDYEYHASKTHVVLCE